MTSVGVINRPTTSLVHYRWAYFMDWANFRAEFPVTRQWAFLDHAAVAPLPAPAAKAICEYAESLANHGIAAISHWTHRVRDVRALAARLVNAAPEEIAFIKNTSEGVGFVADGFHWHPGDNIVLAAEEYPANQYPWLNQAYRGVGVRSVASRGSRIHIDDLRAAMDARTRIVSLSFVEFASGFRNDLNAIGSMCRERGILFLVDAIQGLGVYPLDVRQTPVDFLAADSHKWLLGPEGQGIFWIRRELIDRLHCIGVGWNSVQDPMNFGKIDFRLKPGADRWEGGALNVAGIAGMGASLELLLNTRIVQIEKRVEELTDYLCEQAPRVGLEVFSSRLPGEKSGIVSLRTGERDPLALVKHCRQAGVIVNQRLGRLRVSPHAYNNQQDIDRLLDALRS
ncbi:MAG TPA: aminotransferase class V-fold PLP-dependent enzyme [Gemmataceae bacterium]|nr:aminotransferase class V-fold PLP-dependent enzyme [Gemmataceae bacterium]